MDTDTAEIRTEFDNVAFVPGERLRGHASWRCGATPRTVALRLFYHTEGKGTRDLEVVEEIVFDGPRAVDERAFDFALPAGPHSFSGKLVSLIWALELEVRDDGPVAQRIFTLSPTGEEIDLYRHAHPDMPDYGVMKLGKKKSRAGGRG